VIVLGCVPDRARGGAPKPAEGTHQMKYSVLGSTGVRVSRVCLGTATFGVAPSSDDADGVVGLALDLGINFVDTANVYGSTPTFDRPGAPPAAERESAEEILGRALAGRRDEVVLATKSGERRFDPAAGLSRRYIIQQVEQSLRRLRTSHRPLLRALPRPGHSAGADPRGVRRPDPAGEAALRRPVQPPRLAAHRGAVDR
jgi:predicted oxidoreductase